MPNMSLQKNKMPFQDPTKRIKNFEEVALGYTEEQAIDEAKRCFACKTRPCCAGCPICMDIPGFLAEAAAGRFEQAYQILSKHSNLPSICGRVCSQETQCEARCTRGIKGDSVGIGGVERFVADWHFAHNATPPTMPVSNGHKVAIVGSGPAGLSCAYDLAQKGYQVTVFEALHVAGGVLVYGIPEFRLPKAIVQREVDKLTDIGVKVETNMLVGKIFSVDELLKDFEAVFVGSGAGLPKFMNIPGENLNGVYSANEFLTRVNLMKAYLPDSTTPVLKPKKVAVVGGGNVAMDAARCALRLGAEQVSIVYRRGIEELPACADEILHAKEEGVVFRLLTKPVEIIADQNFFVSAMKCVEMTLGEPDETGRRKPIEKPNTEFVMDVDCVIMAIGTAPNPLIKATTDGLQTHTWGGIIIDEDGKTTRQGVYAGGDIVTGAATVVAAMGAGKKAAESIDKYVTSKYSK